MKVCLFLPWYSPAQIGGTELHLLQLARKIISYGGEAIIICPSPTTNIERFKIEGIEVIASPYIISTPSSFKIAIGLKPPPHVDKFCLLLEQINPHILHFHCFWPKHILYLEVAKKLGIKTVITPHLASFSCLRGNLLFKDKIPCDGAVLIKRCSDCLLNKKIKNEQWLANIVSIVSKILYELGINSGYSLKIQRIFSTPYVIRYYLTVLQKINSLTDAFIVLSTWFEKVLLK